MFEIYPDSFKSHFLTLESCNSARCPVSLPPWALHLIWFLFYTMWAHGAKLLLSRRASQRLLAPENSPIAHCAWAEDMIVIQLTMGSVLLGRRRKLMFLPFSAHLLIPPSTVFPIQAFTDVLMARFQIGLNHGNVTMNFLEKAMASVRKVNLVSE